MPDEALVKQQIIALKKLGICNMMDLDKVKYFASELNLQALVKALELQKSNFRLLVANEC